MKYMFWVWLILAGVPLIVYPAVLLANLMSLAGHPSPTPVPIALRMASQAFLWSSTLYPVAYIWCARKAVQLSRDEKYSSALRVSLLPLFYLVIVAVFLAAFYVAWMQAAEQ